MSASFSIPRLKAKPISKRSSFGFTLIELLAVVAIFAIIASMVVLNLGSDPHRIMQSTAKRFVGQLELISEEAAMRGIEFGLLLDEEQGTYQFLIYDELPSIISKVEIPYSKKNLATTIKTNYYHKLPFYPAVNSPHSY